MLAGTTAVILAGGKGTRLSGTVDDRPKVLAAVNGKPFLSYLLGQLKAAGIRRVVLCTGYMGDMIRESFGIEYDGMALAYSHESIPLGTGGALRLALPLSDSDPVLVMNGDSYCQVDLEAFFLWRRERDIPNAMVLTFLDDVARFGSVDMDGRNRITRFREKTEEISRGFINAGIYLLGKKAISRIPADRPVSLEREIFPALVEEGIGGFQSRGRFIDIGTPESYRGAEAFFADLNTGRHHH
jgi:D-glycero-alpha-D-manno-heptose 1-phosphate guanylyltransferase